MQQIFSPDEMSRLEAMSVFEKRLRGEGFARIAGVDEAGRGPLAGPVVAAACMLPDGVLFERLNDSKQLLPEQREILFAQITACPGIRFGIGKASVAEIDRTNILKATFLAMRRAVSALPDLPDYLLIDGNQTFESRNANRELQNECGMRNANRELQKGVLQIPAEALVGGDGSSVSIAAASILAKVTRDRMMREFDLKWPQYGFKQHKGYATEQHLAALQRWGPCPLHRRTFEPVKGMLRREIQTEFL